MTSNFVKIFKTISWMLEIFFFWKILTIIWPNGINFKKLYIFFYIKYLNKEKFLQIFLCFFLLFWFRILNVLSTFTSNLKFSTIFFSILFLVLSSVQCSQKSLFARYIVSGEIHSKFNHHFDCNRQYPTSSKALLSLYKSSK